MALCALCLSFLSGCGEVWTDPLSTAAEYDKGLVVMYPGALVSDSEMLGFWGTFRLAGVNQAIEVAQWTTPLSYEINSVEANRTSRASAVVEAQRLAEYIRAHPNSPVTLLGYSAGAMYAIMVAEVMPADAPLDKLILMSSSISHKYDLVPALDHTREGALAYWSPNEFTLSLLIAILGTTDLTHDPAAGYVGFDTVDPRLTQLKWTPEMETKYGQNGEHSAYLYNLSWIADYIVPYVPRTKP